ncbi:hypothetical protein J421_0774 [Gemmatirosa kalamazoonensis]|uniref:Uncharacterized protein n=1 Tax=Gemmatirosa kalamazoonensis TaxID=861299 RepID=W0RC06_9BACT|nr:hypothetical protein [Gemmatirosa kalamazoonensis]AHG88311.1 hypothetical protein J421_0774 [Gemmatirosa kalamazoonensis]
MSHNRLEPLADGFVAFHTEQGERWRHKDMSPARAGPGYRLFINEAGEERRYEFGEHESHDATVLDLRDQLARAKPAPAGAA